MVTIQVDEHTAERIAALAKASGVTAAEYLKNLLADSGGKKTRLPIDKFMDEVEQLSVDGPSLPADFSRSDIYSDHD